METPEGKVSLLDAVPVRCDHILTEWEGDYAVISYPRFKYEWMRRLLLPQSMSPDIHVRLEEHGSAVWRLIDGRRTVREIVSSLPIISILMRIMLHESQLMWCNYERMDL